MQRRVVVKLANASCQIPMRATCSSRLVESPSSLSTEQAISSISEELASYGFDICHPFHTSWYNSQVVKEGLEETLSLLPNSHFRTDDVIGTETPETNALVIANTRLVWPKFIEWLRKKTRPGGESMEKQNTSQCPNDDEDDLRNRKDFNENSDPDEFTLPTNPFDTYTTETIHAIISRHAHYFSAGKKDTNAPRNGGNNDDPDSTYEVFWAHDTNMSRLISMQRVAMVSGLCYFDDVSKFTVHPIYGTWKSFRAVVLFNVNKTSSDAVDCTTPALPPPPPPRVKCLISEQESIAIEKAMSLALSVTNLEDFSQQLDGTVSKQDESVHNAWIALRDCINLGKTEYRYSEEQLLYHYTKDPAILLKEMNSLSNGGEGS